MIEGVDYCFIYPKEDAQGVNIKFLQGPIPIPSLSMVR